MKQNILDELFKEFWQCAPDSYPKWNFWTNEGEYYLQFGLAGYKAEGLSFEIEPLAGQQLVTLKGEKGDLLPEKAKVFNRSLPFRAFTWQGRISADLEYERHEFENGLLTIVFKRLGGQKQVFKLTD